MSNVSLAADGALPSGNSAYDRSPQLALGKMPAGARAAWRERYAVQDEGELRVQAILDRAEAVLEAAGTPATIRTLWMVLADRAGQSGNADLKAVCRLDRYGDGITAVLTHVPKAGGV